MKPIFLTVILLIINFGIIAQNRFALGAVYDKQKYDKIETVSPALKFSNYQRIKYSLKAYCPIPGSQGDIGSCTSWATGYAGATIAQAILENNTNTTEITNKAKSALFIYNQIKLDKADCLSGAFLNDAIEFVEKYGDCDLKDFNPENCKLLPGAKEFENAEKFKIKNHLSLWTSSASKESKIISTINSLNANKPVLITMQLMNSFKTVSKNNSKYIPQNGNYGRHALCVIGYDDTKQEFEIMNSWNTTWGNKGFFTISYNDYAEYTLEAFQFILSKNNNQEKKLSGEFDVLKYIGTNKNNNEFKSSTPYFSSDNCYYLNEPLRKDDIFRIKASNLLKDSYVYIISYKPDETTEILFPTHYNSNKASIDMPFIPDSNVTIELPIDSENGYSADQKGDDILCIIYSNQKISSLDNKIKTLKKYKGDIWSWLRNSFGENLIDPSDMTFTVNKMGLSVKNRSKGNIASLVLKVKVK